jgi:hypothetical protein
MRIHDKKHHPITKRYNTRGIKSIVGVTGRFGDIPEYQDTSIAENAIQAVFGRRSKSTKAKQPSLAEMNNLLAQSRTIRVDAAEANCLNIVGRPRL